MLKRDRFQESLDVEGGDRHVLPFLVLRAAADEGTLARGLARGLAGVWLGTNDKDAVTNFRRMAREETL
jgi:hypothetical protein